jgi:hypothetical protein
LLGLVALGSSVACARTVASYNPAEVCQPAAGVADVSPLLIDDAEDGDNQVVCQGERDGYVYTFVDRDTDLVGGSTLEHRRATPIVGGAAQSRCAWNMRGKLSAGRIAFAGLGMNMKAPKAAYDASGFSGVSFFARRSPGSSAHVRVHFPDRNSDPDGGVCTVCFNDFGADVVLGEEWHQFVLPFDSLRQRPGWGAPRPPRIDPSALYGIQFRVQDKGAPFDVWIDDVAFIAPTPAPAASAPAAP